MSSVYAKSYKFQFKSEYDSPKLALKLFMVVPVKNEKEVSN